MSIVSASLFTIAIVSIVFRPRDFHFKIACFRHKKREVYVVASQQDKWTLTIF